MAPSDAHRAEAAIPQVAPPKRTNHSVPYRLLTYKEAEYGAYPSVPMISTFLTPILLARMPKMVQPNTMILQSHSSVSTNVAFRLRGAAYYPKVNAFDPFTRYGSCWPPAPVLFKAFQIPGWVKEINP